MNLSRRRFLGSSVALTGTALLAPALLGSCSLRSKENGSEMDYLGNREGFEMYREYFRRTGVKSLDFLELEESLNTGTSRVLLDVSTPTKPAYVLMLLEQGKDILTPYPLGYNLSDYSNISEFLEKYGRFIGIMDPLAQYPSFEALRKLITREGVVLKRVSIRCHPRNLVDGFPVAGLTGPAQNLERAVSRAGSTYPLAYQAACDDSGELYRIRISYRNFHTEIDFDAGQSGWGMRVEGEGFRAELDQTGLLALEGEVEPRFSTDPGIFRKSVRLSVRDFLSATRDRSEPRVNHLDGLASIILNSSVEKSMRTGREVTG
jgi:hypothetical protein